MLPNSRPFDEGRPPKTVTLDMDSPGSPTYGETGGLRLPFEKSMEQREAPRFYAMPRPKLPDKP